ncbi:hypothetical protein KPATCC21470_4598 [Kitasatospora purpeofusca]
MRDAVGKGSPPAPLRVRTPTRAPRGGDRTGHRRPRAAGQTEE